MITGHLCLGGPRKDTSDPIITAMASGLFEQHFGEREYPHATVEEQLAELGAIGLTDSSLEAIASGTRIGNIHLMRMVQGGRVGFHIAYGPPWMDRKEVEKQLLKALSKAKFK